MILTRYFYDIDTLSYDIDTLSYDADTQSWWCWLSDDSPSWQILPQNYHFVPTLVLPHVTFCLFHVTDRKNRHTRMYIPPQPKVSAATPESREISKYLKKKFQVLEKKFPSTWKKSSKYLEFYF